MRAEKPPLPSFLRVLRPVFLIGASIYLTAFAAVGSVVISHGPQVWHPDMGLLIEVPLWVLFATGMLVMASEEVRKL